MLAQADDTGATDRLLQNAVAAFRTGKFEEAEGLCQRILAAATGSCRESSGPCRDRWPIGRAAARHRAVAEGHCAPAPLARWANPARKAAAARWPGFRGGDRAREGDRAEPESAAYNDLGLINLAEINAAEAVRCFGRAIEISPDLAIAHYNLGLALQWQGLFSDAIAAFRRAIAIAPDFAEAHAKLGNLLMFNGDRRRGSIASAAPPNSTRVGLMCQAKLLMEEEKAAAAEDPARRAINRNPQNSDTPLLLARLHPDGVGPVPGCICRLRPWDCAQPAPDRGTHYELVQAKKLGEADRPLIALMEWMLKEYSLADEERADVRSGPR